MRSKVIAPQCMSIKVIFTTMLSSVFALSVFTFSIFVLNFSLPFCAHSKCQSNGQKKKKRIKEDIKNKTASLNREFGNGFKLGFKPRAAGFLPT